jgi:predicted NBD/HSP70 family sugar kinase
MSTTQAPRNPRDYGAGRALRSGAKVLPEQARAHNRALVLQTLFHQGAQSRADLARETGLTRVTISDLVAALIADRFVVELGVRESSGPGKPATLVDIDRTGHRIVGIDLSGTDAFLGALLTMDGEIQERREVPVPPPGSDVVAVVAALAADLVAASAVPVLGIGVGSPGIVDDDGVVLAAPNFAWERRDLESELSHILGVPVLVANDANAAVLAEYTFGGSEDDVLLVKIGRGVGSGVLTAGRPLAGSRFAAGEIGHVTVGTDGGPVCVCGKIGCLEAWISVPALTARLAESDDEETSASVLADAGERLGIALAPIVGALDLSEIVLSGPEDLLAGRFATSAVDTLRARTMPAFHDRVRVRMTEHGADIVLRGAAVMVLSGRLGVS